MSKNILVTGGSGFIGSHVVDVLIKKRHKVTVFDLTPPKRRDVRFIKGSVLDKTAINSALKNINIIFHLAAVSDINKVKKTRKSKYNVGGGIGTLFAVVLVLGSSS